MTAQRIVIALQDFARGGTERIAIGLAKDWTDAGRDVTILCGAEDGGLRADVDPRVTVVALNPPVRRGLLSRFALGRAMGRQLAHLRPDVIFLPGNYHLLLARALRRADARPAIVLKISNPPLLQGLAGWLAAPIFRYFVRAVDGFAAMNRGLARDLAALYPDGAITTLHDPVYVGAHTQTGTPRRDGVLHILWAGRLEPQKDAALALRVIAALARRVPVHLTLLGDGAGRAQVDRDIAALKLSDHVTRIGQVPDIGPYFQSADVFLITSRYEGGPAVAVEALFHGVPLVSTDCSHLLREIMTISDAGKIVESRDPGDLAAALLSVCQAPRPPIEALRALTAPFARLTCAHAYLDWFDGIASRRHV